MTPKQWAHEHVSPPSFTACGHARHSCADEVSLFHLTLRTGDSECLDCGHRWGEHPIALSDDEYDTLVAYMAFRLDSK